MQTIEERLGQMLAAESRIAFYIGTGVPEDVSRATREKNAQRHSIAADWNAMVEAAEKLLDEAERIALAALDGGRRHPHLERASANMGEILARVKGES